MGRSARGRARARPPVNRKLIHQLAAMLFTEGAHNAVLVGGPGTGKTHLATAIGVSDITRHGKRVRFYCTGDRVNALEHEKAQGKARRIALSLLPIDLVTLDERGYLSFSQAGGALLFPPAEPAVSAAKGWRRSASRHASRRARASRPNHQTTPSARPPRAGGIRYGLRPARLPPARPTQQQGGQRTIQTLTLIHS